MELTENIWEFRTIYKKTHYRISAFWHKIHGQDVLVLATHGLIKKTDKTPKADLDKAERIRVELEMLGNAIKRARTQQRLTQEQLDAMVGVQKAQISKLENNFTNARFDTVMKVFHALDARVKFHVEL